MKKLIIYKDVKSLKELCRDNECLFEPHPGDIIDLSEFPLNNSLPGPKFEVYEREIFYGGLIVYLFRCK